MTVRNLKTMWKLIAEELCVLQKKDFTANNCENRWRVLERNYKKFVDNKTSTGRGRKDFEFYEDMDKIYGKKKNVNPDMVLSSCTIDECVEECQEVLEEPSQGTSGRQLEKPTILTENNRQPRKRKSILDNIRLDKKKYQDERIEIEKQKLLELRRRNYLIEKRNKILKEQKCTYCKMQYLFLSTYIIKNRFSKKTENYVIYRVSAYSLLFLYGKERVKKLRHLAEKIF